MSASIGITALTRRRLMTMLALIPIAGCQSVPVLRPQPEFSPQPAALDEDLHVQMDEAVSYLPTAVIGDGRGHIVDVFLSGHLLEGRPYLRETLVPRWLDEGRGDTYILHYICRSVGDTRSYLEICKHVAGDSAKLFVAAMLWTAMMDKPLEQDIVMSISSHLGLRRRSKFDVQVPINNMAMTLHYLRDVLGAWSAPEVFVDGNYVGSTPRATMMGL